MRCIGAFTDGSDLVLFTEERLPFAAGLQQPRHAIDRNSIISWSVHKHTTEYPNSSGSKPGQVYQMVAIHTLGNRVFEFHVRVGQWINANESIEYDTGLIDELVSMLQRRFGE